MKHNKFILILSFSLLTSIFLVGCGAQATPEPTPPQASQKTDPEPAPATASSSMAETEVPTEAAPTEAPTEIPTEAPTEASVAAVSFANDVMPIIQSRCVNCHGGERIEEGLLMRSYHEIMAGSDNGPVIVPGDVAGSLLIELVTSKEMPKRGPKLTPPQIQIISDWVAAGALNN